MTDAFGLALYVHSISVGTELIYGKALHNYGMDRMIYVYLWFIFIIRYSQDPALAIWVGMVEVR